MKTKKGFTLVEMLVVIGIIGILVATLVTSMAGGTESARAAKCLANLRTLAAATQSYGMATGFYPCASSVEVLSVDASRGWRNVTEGIREVPGWISWYAPNVYPANGSDSKKSDSFLVSTYASDDRVKQYCLTNGALWKYVSANRSVYVCPEHVKVAKKKKLNPTWSYQMNGWFECCQAWNTQKGTKYNGWAPRQYNKLHQADKRLLFAEMPFVQHKGGTVPKMSNSAGDATDCTLLYDGMDKDVSGESFGFNHKVGKEYVAHIVYADCHVEKLRMPRKGLSESDAEKLTSWLCSGLDVSFNGSKYEWVK